MLEVRFNDSFNKIINLPTQKHIENPINRCLRVRSGKQLSFLALEATNKAA